MVIWMIVRQELTTARRYSGRRYPDRLTPDELELIRLVLPASALDFLEVVTGGFLPTEMMALRLWAGEAAQRKYWRRDNRSTAYDRYQQLDPDEREVVDLLPPAEILDRLSR